MLTITVALMALVPKATGAPAPAVAPPASPPPSVLQIPVVWLPPVPERIPFINLAPPPTELPRATRDLIMAAYEAGDDATVTALFKLAKRTHPQAIAQIEALEAEIAARRAEKIAQEARERADRLGTASLLQNWKGEVELGGSHVTGNARSLAIYGSLSLDREGLNWQHSIKARADFQRSNGITTADRYRLSWQPNYKINDRFFVYGLAQYDRDRFLGFASRLTGSVGAGLKLISTSDAQFSIQGGPAIRYTDLIDDGSKTNPAARASLSLRWKLTPTLSLSQDTALYLETGNTNAQSTTSIDTHVLGNHLKARFSYDVQYEDDQPGTAKSLATTSRATLVYSF